MRKSVWYMLAALFAVAGYMLFYARNAARTAIARSAVATIKREMLRVDSAQRAFRDSTGSFALTAAELPGLTLKAPVTVTISAATESAFTAEGRNAAWEGVCRLEHTPVDTLPEARCQGPVP
jgi:hypothetical protein